MQADVAVLELECLEQNVYIVVPDLRDQRLVGIDPHAAHAGLLPHGSLTAEPNVHVNDKTAAYFLVCFVGTTIIELSGEEETTVRENHHRTRTCLDVVQIVVLSLS